MIDANNNQVTYQGLTTLRDVEFYKMGQLNNFKAALRFENSNLSSTAATKSTVEACVIHESVGWGVSVKYSQNIDLLKIDVFDVTQIGVSLDQNVNITADSVNVYGVRRRELALMDNIVDRESCFSVCAFTDDMPCQTTKVINSIVAGCPYAGFIAPGHSCSDPVGESTTVYFKNNVAHSCNGSGFGLFPDVTLSDKSVCYQGSYLMAYKNDQAGIGFMTKSDKVIISNIVSVDNTLGLSLNLATETNTEKIVLLQDSHIFGETSDLAKDCPDGSGGNTGADCYCVDKIGHMSILVLQGGKDPHNPSASKRPVYKAKTYATWNNKAVIENVNFHNFKSENTACGAGQFVFGMNRFGSDLIPMHWFYDVKFTNVKYDALINIFDPPAGWANIDDCGEWPCTAPSNVVYTFYDSLWQVTDGTT